MTDPPLSGHDYADEFLSQELANVSLSFSQDRDGTFEFQFSRSIPTTPSRITAPKRATPVSPPPSPSKSRNSTAQPLAKDLALPRSPPATDNRTPRTTPVVLRAPLSPPNNLGAKRGGNVDGSSSQTADASDVGTVTPHIVTKSSMAPQLPDISPVESNRGASDWFSCDIYEDVLNDLKREKGGFYTLVARGTTMGIFEGQACDVNVYTSGVRNSFKRRYSGLRNAMAAFIYAIDTDSVAFLPAISSTPLNTSPGLPKAVLTGIPSKELRSSIVEILNEGEGFLASDWWVVSASGSCPQIVHSVFRAISATRTNGGRRIGPITIQVGEEDWFVVQGGRTPKSAMLIQSEIFSSELATYYSGEVLGPFMRSEASRNVAAYRRLRNTKT